MSSLPPFAKDLAAPCLALFDLDGTLTWRDTLASFLAGYLARNPVRCLRLWRLPVALAHFALDRDRGALKSQVIRVLMGGDSRSNIDRFAESFCESSRPHLYRPAALACLEAHRNAGDTLVLLSASPDLYVPRIGHMLGFKRTLCTELRWHGTPPKQTLDGALLTANRRGEEKSRCLISLKQDFPGLKIVAYGNSTSDLPHLCLADAALLVNGNRSARRRALALGITCGDWR